jgi:uncharacterized protein (TIGR02147 family)
MLPDIYKYLDYRQYLMDLFAALNQRDPSFSLRRFARIAGSTSPNYLQLIRSRKLNLHPDALDAIAHDVPLKKKEADFLKILVNFDHAKTHGEKDLYFRKILQKREYKSIKTLTREQFQFFSHWYIPVVRELVIRDEYPGDPEWIAGKVMPPISESKARKGIALLEKLGLIRQDPTTQKWEMTQNVISTPSEVLSLAIATYHRDVIALAGEAIDRFKKPERDIRSVTLGLTADGVVEAKRRLEMFWKEMLEFGGTQNHAKRVFQLNMQLFPLSNEDDQ